MVKVKYYGLIRNYTKVTEDDVSIYKVSSLIKWIGNMYGKEAIREAKRSFILLNGENVGLGKGYRTHLNDGDTVQIMTVTGGG